MKILESLKKLFTPKITYTNKINHVQSFEKIIAAKVVKVEKHPNADRLRIVTLDAGSQTVSPVVCGAFNFSEGAIVALALPGAYIPKSVHAPEKGGFTLEKAKIRGVESQGMLCAAFELGLSDSVGEGIMILKDSSKPGSNFSADLVKS